MVQLDMECVRGTPVSPRTPDVVMDIGRGAFTQATRYIYAHGPRPEYRQEEDWILQQEYIPARAALLVRPRMDIVVMPRSAATEAAWETLAATLGLSADQVVWTRNKEFVMDLDIATDDAVLSALAKRVSAGGGGPNWEVSTYSQYPEVDLWMPKLSAMCPGLRSAKTITKAALDRQGHKGTLHPLVPGTADDGVMVLPCNIPRPRGFRCRNNAELGTALACMRKPMARPGHPAAGVLPPPAKVVLKPIWGTDGDGIHFLPIGEASTEALLSSITIPDGGFVLEEMLSLDTDAAGNVVSPTVHFVDKVPCWPGTVDQVLDGPQYIGSSFPTLASPDVLAQCERAAIAAIMVLDLPGPGGFDFLSERGHAMITDVNLGRFNGGHYSRAFVKNCTEKLCGQVGGVHQRLANLNFVTFRAVWMGPTISNVLQVLSDCGLILNLPGVTSRPCSQDSPVADAEVDLQPAGTGVLPMLYIQDTFGLLVAFGSTPEHCNSLRIRACSALQARFGKPVGSTDLAKQKLHCE